MGACRRLRRGRLEACMDSGMRRNGAVSIMASAFVLSGVACGGDQAASGGSAGSGANHGASSGAGASGGTGGPSTGSGGNGGIPHNVANCDSLAGVGEWEEITPPGLVLGGDCGG